MVEGVQQGPVLVGTFYQTAYWQTYIFLIGMGVGMRMGITGRTPMRHVAGRLHNPYYFGCHCHWHSMHTHSQPQSGGIRSRRFHLGPAEPGLFSSFISFFANST